MPSVSSTKAKVLELANSLLDNDPGALSDSEKQKYMALISFYANPPGPGLQYSWNHLWVMGSEFNQLFTKMEKLVWEGIESAKQKATKRKRAIEAVRLFLQIWEKGHHFDAETGHVAIVPVPVPKRLGAKDRALIAESVKATWRHGSRNS